MTDKINKAEEHELLTAHLPFSLKSNPLSGKTEQQKQHLILHCPLRYLHQA